MNFLPSHVETHLRVRLRLRIPIGVRIRALASPAKGSEGQRGFSNSDMLPVNLNPTDMKQTFAFKLELGLESESTRWLPLQGE
jgi:hypothetical protein